MAMLAVISPPLRRLQSRGRIGCLRISNRGVLLLDVIMNIAVIIYWTKKRPAKNRADFDMVKKKI